MELVRVQLLGPVTVRTDGAGVVPVAGARPRALLARLALAAGEVVPAGTLVADLWGEAAPGTNALHTLISRLRRSLAADPDAAERLESSGAGYRLAVTRADVDALQAEDLAERAAASVAAGDWAAAHAAAHAGLALFRGPALPDVGDPPYAVGASGMLEELRVTLTEQAADAALGGGGLPDLAQLGALARAHPLRERLQGTLIRSLYAAGRQADALAAYDRTRRQLADELGVDPSPGLEQIHVAVLRQDATALGLAAEPGVGGAPGTWPPTAGAAALDPAAPHTNLRTALTSFVGRDGEVAQVLEALRDHRLVTLVGPGGAGKTRLALETGRRLTDTLPAGVWLVELAPVHDPLDLPHAVLSALGLREKALLERTREGLRVGEHSDVMARLVDGLAGAELLIVLDNCEHLIAAVAQLADQVLGACPGVHLLATSREPLGITGETLCPLPPLALPPADATAGEATGYAAVRLLVDRAVAVHPGFVVDAETVGPVVSIVRRLDGLPLAIELAAARMRAMSPAQIAARLDDRFRLLTGGSRTALPRHRTLLAVVEWSWDLLEKPERLLLQRLAVFAGPVSLETVEAVCADEDLPRDDVLDLVATLVDKSLVDAIGAGDVRYRLLETVRAFGADRLAESGEAATVRDRHAAYLLDLVETADPLLRSGEELHWLAVLDALRDDVIAGLRWCIDSGQADPAVRFVASLGWYLHLRGMNSEMAHWPVEALALSGAADPAARAIAQTFAAMGAAGDGDLAAGEGALQKAIDASGPIRGQAHHPILALLEPGMLLFQLEFDAGMAAVDEIVAHHPDLWTRGVALILQGHALENFGDMGRVPGCYERAFEIFSDLGERWGQAISLSSLGEILEGRGDYVEAMHGYERALSYLRQLGTTDDVTMTLTRLARMRLMTGDRAGGERALVEARELADRFNIPAQAALVDVTAAEFARTAGDLTEAERRLRAVVLESTAGGFGPMQIHAMLASQLARVLVDSEQLAEARDVLVRSLAYAKRSRDVPVQAEVMMTWARLALAEGDALAAARLLGISVAVRGTPLAGRGDAADLAEEIRARLSASAYDEARAGGEAHDRTSGLTALVEWAGVSEDDIDGLVSGQTASGPRVSSSGPT